MQTRRGGDDKNELGALDAAAIERVRDEVRPDPRDADELHDALMIAGFSIDDDFRPEAEAAAPPSSVATAFRRKPIDEQLLELARAGRAARVTLAPTAESREFRGFAIAAERLPELLAIHPDARLDPPTTAPASRLARRWTRAEAIAELVRARLTLAGPVTAAAVAETLGVDVAEIDEALLLLESEGVVLRGHFTPPASDLRRPTSDLRRPTSDLRRPTSTLEWCDRALLARIHRYTVNRLRAEIEPVSPADFMRFLFKWQHVDATDRLIGLDGLREVLAMLDGYELAAGAWERSVIPPRVDGYDPSMLDLLCLAGEVGWARLSPPSRTGEAADPPRLAPGTPIALFLREHADAWLSLRAGDGDPESLLTPAARRVLETLRSRGASFFGDLRAACDLDQDEARRVVGLLAATGLAASDGFSGLRALIWSGRHATPDRRANFAGRWTAIGTPTSKEKPEAATCERDAVERQAWALLRRYGVVFRRLLAREPNAAPWRELVRVYRRLEARGEIRGGRFVAGMSGEQFALAGAVERLREVRRTPAGGEIVVISAADPLNLAGIVTAGERVRAAGRNRIAWRDGVPLAVREAEFVRELTPIDPAIAPELSRALNRRRAAALYPR